MWWKSTVAFVAVCLVFIASGEDEVPEEEFVKVAPNCLENLPDCPAGKKPYSVYYHHSNGFETQILPNLNTQPQIPEEGLFHSNKFFLALKKDKDRKQQDIFEIKVLGKKEVDFRKICFRTFMVKTVDIELFRKEKKGFEMIKDFEVETVAGRDWFRAVTSPSEDGLIKNFARVSLILQSEAPTYNIKDVVLLTCVPGKVKGKKGQKAKKGPKKSKKRPKKQ